MQTENVHAAHIILPACCIYSRSWMVNPDSLSICGDISEKLCYIACLFCNTFKVKFPVSGMKTEFCFYSKRVKVNPAMLYYIACCRANHAILAFSYKSLSSFIMTPLSLDSSLSTLQCCTRWDTKQVFHIRKAMYGTGVITDCVIDYNYL